MPAHLPFVMQGLFNTPLALNAGRAEMIVAALSGKLNISELIGASGTMDRRAMSELAAMGRRSMPNQIEAASDPLPGAMVEGQWWYGDRPYELTESGIAILPVLGTLTRTWGVGPESGKTGYDGLWTQLLYAQDDKACKAIWLQINSGGGAVDGLFDLADGIWSYSARNGGKPIYAFAGDFAYSAAYAIGAAADWFGMPELGGVGSIGTLMLVPDFSEMLANDGIKVRIVRAPDRKAIGIGGVEPIDDEQLAHLQELVAEATAVFQDRVSTYRGRLLTKSAVSKTRGLDYSGAKARAIGLVNDVMSEPEAWAKLERRIAR